MDNPAGDASRPRFRWLGSGAVGLAAMEQAIGQARHSVDLQVYIFEDGRAARRILQALVAAATRGVRVRVLVDALGSMSLPAGFFDSLTTRGGQFRAFNPLHPRRLVYRNHRKALVCDRQLAVVGGFNIADEYDGDGVNQGWLDLGLEITGPLVAGIDQAFEQLFARAEFKTASLAWLRRARESDHLRAGPDELLLSSPGRNPNPIKRSLLRDLGKANRVCIASAYFLPTWGLRRRLMKRARAGARVQLLLPALSDVPLAQAAGRFLYGRLLRAGVEIREYKPQVLHAKLVIADSAVYIGSANFNTRSLHIDYELLVRTIDPAIGYQAREWFDASLARARRIRLDDWRRKRTLMERLWQRFAYFLMARLDPLIARWLWKKPDHG